MPVLHRHDHARSASSIKSLLSQREPRLFLLTAALDALGTGLVLPVTVLFFTVQVGLSPVQLGVGLSVAGACGVAATPIAGILLDRYAARTVGAACHLASAAAFTGYLLVRNCWTFVLV